MIWRDKRMLVLGSVLLAGGCILGGCERKEKAAESEKTRVQRDDREPLKFSIWSDEETYVRDVVEAYNALKGYEAISLEVIPNSQHEDWINAYTDDYGTVSYTHLTLPTN